jgi:glycosyltransferase involved in cell wall biosynthesis
LISFVSGILALIINLRAGKVINIIEYVGWIMKIDVVVPVYNEQVILDKTIIRLHSFLKKYCSDEWQITIANNASNDNTLKIAKELEGRYSRLRIIHLDQKGRGRALKKAWNTSNADIMCYMDADLATDLEAFPRLVNSIKNGAVVATGNRFHKNSVVGRGIKRTTLSKGYNILAKFIVGTRIPDLQCGFKAISRRAKQELLPKIQDNVWFFDSELLIIAEKMGHPVAQVPVKWKDSERSSKVRIVNTAKNYINNLFALRKRLKKQGLL